jgi:hypothetical protein
MRNATPLRISTFESVCFRDETFAFLGFFCGYSCFRLNLCAFASLREIFPFVSWAIKSAGAFLFDPFQLLPAMI